MTQSQEITKMTDDMSNISKNALHSDRIRTRINSFGMFNKENIEENSNKAIPHSTKPSAKNSVMKSMNVS